MRFVLIVVLNINIVIFSQENISSLYEDVVLIYDTLKSYEPSVFNQIPDDVTILALGEASHGQGSFFSHKGELFKNLVKYKNFKSFALEAGIPECDKINRYILYGEGSSIESLKFLGYGVWEIAEFVNLIEWMKGYNDNIINDIDKLEFYGIDCQKTHGIVGKIKKYLNKYSSLQNIETDKLLIDLLYMDNRVDRKMAKNMINPVNVLVDSILLRIDGDDSYSLKEKSFIRFELTSLIQKCEMDSKRDKKSYQLRAKYMAKNAVNIQHHLGKKAVLSAHNGHVFKVKSAKEMGFFIQDRIKKSYYSIGFDFKGGSITGFTMDSAYYYSRVLKFIENKEGSLSLKLGELSTQDYFIDFRTLTKEKRELLNHKYYMHDIMGCFGNPWCNSTYWKVNPIHAYDGILYVQETFPSSILWMKRPIKGWKYE